MSAPEIRPPRNGRPIAPEQLSVREADAPSYLPERAILLEGRKFGVSVQPWRARGKLYAPSTIGS